MISSGQNLYEHWAKHMEVQGVSVDEWNDLEIYDRVAWENLADELEEEKFNED